MMMTAAHVSVRYGAQTVLHDVSFTLDEGEWLMLCGPNGAGKSTLVKALTKVVPSTGSVSVMGRDLRRLSYSDLARDAAVLCQSTHADGAFTVSQVVELGRYAHSRGLWTRGDTEGPARVAQALQMVGMADKAEQSVLTLSGGEWQRVMLAQVFAQDPKLLLLDEPANHLDLKYQRQIFDLIDAWRRTPGRAVLSVVHDLSLARRYGTHALLLDKGECIAAGPLSSVLTRPMLHSVYGMDVFSWMTELSQLWDDA